MKKSNNGIEFENDEVRVFKTLIPHDRSITLKGSSHIVVGLGPGQLRQGEKNILEIEPKQAYWVTHPKIRSCDKPLEVMIIEMKGPKTHILPSIPID